MLMIKKEIQKTLKTVWEPFKDFNFSDDASRSAHLAAVLLTVHRQNLPTAPGIFYSGPEASGKTLLASCLSSLASTKKFIMIDISNKKNLEAKIRGEVILASKNKNNLVILDNMSRKFYSDFLCIWLSNNYFTDRVSEKVKSCTVLTDTIIVITSREKRLQKDMYKRLLFCKLNASKKEVFNVDPHKHCIENRKEIRGAIKILLKYIGECNIHKSTSMVFFSAWAEEIGNVIDEFDGVIQDLFFGSLRGFSR